MIFISKLNEVILGPESIVYVTDPSLIGFIYEECLNEIAIGVDVETTGLRALPPDFEFNDNIFKPGLDPYLSEIRLLQIATSNCVYVIDCWACPDVSLLGFIMSSPRILKVGHNFKFDMKMMMRQWGFVFERIYDTMLAAQLLTNGISSFGNYRLDNVVSQFLRIQLSKEEQKSNWGAEVLTPSQITYAGLDVAVLLPLCSAQLARMVDTVNKIDYLQIAKIEFDCAIAVAQLELDGLYVDPVVWKNADLDIRARYFDVSKALKEALGKPDINLDSPKQIKKALAEMGIIVESTNSKYLASFADKYPVIGILLECRGLAKLLSSYGNGIPGKKRKKTQVLFLERVHPITGRIHSEFGQLRTGTGRFNSQRPNVQQIPNLEKGAFRTACSGQVVDGVKNLYIVADWSQFEMRILAALSGDPKLIGAFQMGDDIHTATAAIMFDVPIETIVAGKDAYGEKIKGSNYWMRNAAKSINFGLVYGRGIRSLAAQLGVTVERAKELNKQYFETFSVAAEWLTKTALEGVRIRRSGTLLGRVRYFEFDILRHAEVATVERESKNTPIQGLNADILKLALYRVYKAIRKYNGRVKIVNIIHDELNLEAPPELAEEVCSLVKTIMEQTGEEILKCVPVVAEAAYGSDWTIK